MKKILYITLLSSTLSFACNCDQTLNGEFTLKCGDFSIFLGDNHKSACCKSSASNYDFSIKDKGRSDNNISTKKISDNEFDLTIDSDSDFSGKVYSVIQDNDKNISDINTSTWDSETEKNITIKNLKKISKEAYIYVKWESDNGNKGEQNSTDKFAILPIKYIFDVPTQIKAGENYHIEINATDSNDINRSYTQTLDSNNDKNSTIVFIHKDGSKEDFASLKLDFTDGIANREDFNISDIGKYKLELNDTNFAIIDKDDTPEINRTLYGSVDIEVVPYKFRINLKNHQTSTLKKWLYQGQEFNYSLEANITALNKKDEVLVHFDKDEYATDVNTTLKYILTKFDDEDINMTFIKSQNNQQIQKDIKVNNGLYDVNYTIKDSNFTKGWSTNFGIVSFIKKDIDSAKSPIDLNISEINTTSKVAENLGVFVDDNVSYFYPRLNTQDIFTTYKETNTTANILVYDKNSSDAKKRFPNQNGVLVDWYKNLDDTQTDITYFEMRKSSNRDSDFIDINLTKSTANKSDIQIEVDNNTTTKTKYGVIHLDTPSYLWYSKYNKEYSYTNDSSCLNHYCIEYNYQGTEQNYYDVGSGAFNGPETNNTLQIDTDRKGVKIYR